MVGFCIEGRSAAISGAAGEFDVCLKSWESVGCWEMLAMVTKKDESRKSRDEMGRCKIFEWMSNNYWFGFVGKIFTVRAKRVRVGIVGEGRRRKYCQGVYKKGNVGAKVAAP